jgi:hypothetical protein
METCERENPSAVGGVNVAFFDVIFFTCLKIIGMVAFYWLANAPKAFQRKRGLQSNKTIVITYYNVSFMQVFVSKVRPLGSSLGVIIPKEILKEANLSEGSEIRLNIVNTDYSALDRLMGSMRGAKPFVRDRRDRPLPHRR